MLGPSFGELWQSEVVMRGRRSHPALIFLNAGAMVRCDSEDCSRSVVQRPHLSSTSTTVSEEEISTHCRRS
jgi:hypothetical protein